MKAMAHANCAQIRGVMWTKAYKCIKVKHMNTQKVKSCFESFRVHALMMSVASMILLVSMCVGVCIVNLPLGLRLGFLQLGVATANAEQSAQQKSNNTIGGITVTDSITDTENLLGEHIAKVSDAITETKKKTGVSVRLLYLSTFHGAADPSRWASDLLMSTKPPANTVLLALATHDGQLVVAVSPNSDEWLRRKATVDALSSRALSAIMNRDGNPDWSGSAIAMMKQIAVAKKTTTTTSASVIATLIMMSVVLLIALIVTIVLWYRRRVRCQIASGLRKPRRRHMHVS